MLKKMRWRFITAAMSAFLAVVLLLMFTINLWNYNITSDRQDSTLETLLELETRQRGEPPAGGGELPIPGPFGGHSREARYMTRFFMVFLDAGGTVTKINQEHIASVSAEDAESFALEVLGKGKTSGYYKGYRFRLEKTDGGTTVAFLNSEREIQYMKTLFLVSGIIAVVSLLAVFALVMLFSGRAIAPYIRNIETQKQFITDAGHELKTPLTSISASADILVMEYPDNEWALNIRKQSARMAKLIASLVKLSRLDEEQSQPEKAEFSLSEAIWEISEPAAALASAKGKSWSQEIPDGIMYFGDKSRIQQMVSALLDNAVKYSDDGGSIRLEVRRRHKKIEILVSNTVPEGTETDTERIFERFYRADKARADTDSFGIGLSVAKAIAEKHRGTITAERIDGPALRFKVTL